MLLAGYWLPQHLGAVPTGSDGPEGGRRLSLQVAADLVRAARLWLEPGRLVTELSDGFSQRDELADLVFEVGEPGVEQVSDVLAGRLAPVADVEDLPDLGEGEPSGLSAVDEVDPGDGLWVVVAVPRRSALGPREETFVLVEPQRLRRRTRCLSEISDPHRVLPCPTRA
jgi:hypothetical protein